MKLSKSQQGIAHVVLVFLLVAVLSGAGFAGYKVYQGNKGKQHAINTSTEQPKEDDKASSIPEGFVEYENKELGFKFAYPKEWGGAEVEPGPENDHLVAGSESVITFTQNNDVTAGLASDNWKHDENLGHGGDPTNAASYTYASWIKEPTFNEKVYSNNDGVIYGTGIAGIDCTGVGYVLNHKLSGNKTYSSLAFLYIEKRQPEVVVDKENPNQEVPADVCTEYKKYLTTEHLDQLKKLFETIKVI